MKKKNHYRIRNWKDYNRNLKQRGSLTFWISQDLIENWIETQKTEERGRPPKYTDQAIRAMASIKFLFHQAGRQTCGLVESIFALMTVKLPVPDHSTLSRRMSGLEIELSIKPKTEPRHIVCDSTGLKVYGEGEWKTKIHGRQKHRTWRKLHLMVDEKTSEIVVAGASTNSVSDGEMFADMLEQTDEPICQVSADGGYDQKKVYQTTRKRKIARVAIPPQKNAVIWQHGNSKAKPLVRDENLRAIRKKGRKTWKQEAEYHRRSLAETMMFRYKQIFTGKLQSRKIENQYQEMFIKCELLNQMSHLGMPISYKVEF